MLIQYVNEDLSWCFLQQLDVYRSYIVMLPYLKIIFKKKWSIPIKNKIISAFRSK